MDRNPQSDTRWKRRVDDRRVISGIVHLLISACRWKDYPGVYGPRKTLYNRFQRWAAKGVWMSLFHALTTAGGPAAELLIDSTAVKAHRCASGGKGGKRGEQCQALGRSSGGRTTKIHALTDRDCRPIASLLTGGQVPDRVAADTLLNKIGMAELVPGEKGYAYQRRARENRSEVSNAQHSSQSHARLEKLLLPLPLQKPRNHQANVQLPQRFSWDWQPL
jgi:transposase